MIRYPICGLGIKYSMNSKRVVIVQGLFFLVLTSCQHTAQHTHSFPSPMGSVSVLDFGAVGDGKTDCAQAFQTALSTVGSSGGGIVYVPTGQYLFSRGLILPDHVTLEGVWRAPHRGDPVTVGSVLHVTAGHGHEEEDPFLRMGTGSTLKGLSIFYPNQVRANPPVPYPWTVQANEWADNIAIRDVTMINPYKAVDFGTYPAGRHYISGLYAYPLLIGLYINQIYDVGRIETIHFWPFWDLDPNSPLWEFTKTQGTAFLIGKTDGQMGHNLFSIFYRYGMRFIAGPIYDEHRSIVDYQAGSGMYSNCYMDVSPCAIRVDAVMEKAGISFTNASIMSRVEVGPENRGPVKFSASGFWATSDLAEHVVLEGRGTVFFEGCHFNDWDRKGLGVPCIRANNRRIIIMGCEFPSERPNQLVLELGPRLRSAIVQSNLMPGGIAIENNTSPEAHVIISDNAVEPLPNYISRWIVLGPFPNRTLDAPTPDGVTRSGFHEDFLISLGGECHAKISPDTSVSLPDTTGSSHEIHSVVVETNPQNRLDLMALYNKDLHVAYAFTWVYSKTEQTAWFEAGLNDGGKLFVNGALVYKRFSPLGMQCVPGKDSFRALLHSGWNALLVKVEDGGGTRWEFIMEAYNEDGTPLHASVYREEFP